MCQLQLPQRSDSGASKERCHAGPCACQEKKLAGNAVLQDSLGCSGHGVVELEILRAVNRAHTQVTALDFRRAGSGLFKDVHCRVPQNRAPEGREAQG